MLVSEADEAFRSSTARQLAGRTILQIVPELDTGGAERTAIDIAEALAAVGARALVACERGRLVSELQAKGGIWVPFPAAAKNPVTMALNTRKLARLIASERAEIVHARSPRASLGGAGRDPDDPHAVCHDLSRQLCRFIQPETALQFGYGRAATW